MASSTGTISKKHAKRSGKSGVHITANSTGTILKKSAKLPGKSGVHIMASSTGTTSKKYAKRSGTSGVQGHLYETKLLSLIYFRAIHDDETEDFHLATNVDKSGSFDDICFRAEVRHFDKPIVVFIQTKHKDVNNKKYTVLTLNSKSDLVKYFKSYLEIRRNFKPNNEDVLFEGAFNEAKCFFVIYTTVKSDKETRTFEGSFAKYLNTLIGTGVSGSQPPRDKKDIELLSKIVLEDQMTALARLMAKCICGEITHSQELMKNEVTIRYHVILAQKLFDVSEDQSEEYRIARFRQDFFDIKEEFLELFKDELRLEISKNRTFEYLVNPFSTDIVCETFETGIIYNKNGIFEFVDETKSSDLEKLYLDEINKSQETIRRTLELTLKEYLPSLEFTVPAAFGNKDLSIKGGEKRNERKLKDLTSNIVSLIERSKPSNIVTIDMSMGKSFLQLSGGIGSAVGNLLVSDDTSNLMKFNDNYESLGKLAKRLFDKLKREISNLHEYKFDIKVDIFPTLSSDFDEYNRNLAEDFLNTLLFYTSQSYENGVEETLKYLITKMQCDYDEAQSKMTCETIFLKYHDEVQKWWMTPKLGSYLTKEGDLYKNAVKHATSQSLIGGLKIMQRLKNKNYTFSEDAVNSIKLDDLPSGTIIVSENSEFTVTKLTQRLNNKDFFVLHLEYIFNLCASNDKILCTELLNMNKVKIVIVVIDKIEMTPIISIKLKDIANAIKNKVIIIITDQNSVEIAKEYFSNTDKMMKDERNNLIDLTEDSQRNILDNTTVIVQGDEVTLEQVLDHTSIDCVGGELLYKIMHSNRAIIGKPVSDLNYTSNLYIKRSVTCLKLSYPKVTQRINNRKDTRFSVPISTIYDIKDDNVLIIGDPGMGKSTLLTHLSLKTKEQYPSVWILRINLLEYSRQFREWQIHKTAIDTLESLKLMCQVALSEERGKKGDVEITLEESNGTVLLKNCTGDAWTVFELKIFLHYYNTKKLIILFDGFDEICPTYSHEVLSLITVVKNWPQKHKMWISSRSYDKINSILVLELSTYRIEPLKNADQRDYLTKFWDEMELLEYLTDDQLRNIYDFIMFMSKSGDINMLMKKKDLPVQKIKDMPFLAIYLNLLKYLRDNKKRFTSRFTFYRGSSKLNSAILVALDSVSNISAYTQDFFTTPLHLNMMAAYLYKQIRETNKNPNKWDLDTNFFSIYERFLETKMKIRFQDKNEHDMYRPDNRSIHMQIYADFIEKHKKLAAYAVYGKCLFDDNELKELKEMINQVKKGEERTGIICVVVDDYPIFVHSTFAEYFAVEYICDLLKIQGNSTSIWDFILNVMFFNCNTNVLGILDAKMKTNEKLTALVASNSKVIFDLLLEQSKNTKNKHGEMKSSLCEAVRYNLRNLGVQLLSTIEHNLNDSNLMDFIEIVRETNMLLIAVKMEFEEIVVTIIDRLRIVNPSKLSALFENIENFEVNGNIDVVSNDEIVQALHSHLWTRMDIVPVWENLAELSGQIYFM